MGTDNTNNKKILMEKILDRFTSGKERLCTPALVNIAMNEFGLPSESAIFLVHVFGKENRSDLEDMHYKVNSEGYIFAFY